MSHLFGKVICYSTKTDDIPPYYKINYALLKVDKHLKADNDLSKLAVRDEEYDYIFDGKALTNSIDPVRVGDTLIKFKICTDLTSGTVIDEAKVRWYLITMTGMRPMKSVESSSQRAILF